MQGNIERKSDKMTYLQHLDNIESLL